jgi:hypothetical protein
MKGSWTIDEDNAITEWVRQNGACEWNKLVLKCCLRRSGKQCRERWINILSRSSQKGPWTSEEDDIILRMRENIGNKWAKIATCLPGRSENHVKNRWHSTLSRRISRVERGEEPKMKSGRRKKEDPAIYPLFERECDELFEKDLIQLPEIPRLDVRDHDLFSEPFLLHTGPDQYPMFRLSGSPSPVLSSRF